MILARCPDIPSFYSTYEELKQKEEKRLKRIYKSFYSTYEELKHEYGDLVVDNPK